MKQFKQFAVLGLMFLSSQPAQAGLIHYAGDLTDGAVRAGQVVNDSIRSLSDFQFWTFQANPGDLLTLIARRSERNHDPVMHIWEGLFADVGDLGRARYRADDEISAPGPYGDPREIFRARTSVYTVGIFDHSAGRSRCSGMCDYTISLSGSTASVPEPGVLALLGTGLALFGWRRRQQRR